jgi:hypothetical protein
LQSFDDIRLYIPPNYVVLNSSTNNAHATSSNAKPSGDAAEAGSELLTLKVPVATAQPSSPSKSADAATSTSSEILEVNFKDMLNQIIENLTLVNIQHWFNLGTSSHASNPASNTNEATASAEDANVISLFDSVLQALNFIDFNLKRNSDFINELTKLLDTSRAIKQEAHLKKLLKALEDEKLLNNPGSAPNLNAAHSTLSQPSSPVPKPANEDNISAKSRNKSKSFKGLIGGGKSKDNISTSGSTTATPTTNFLAPPSPLGGNSPTGSLAKLDAVSNSFTGMIKSENEIISNSDYIELELEVEQIAFSLDRMNRAWTKLAAARAAMGSSNDSANALRYSIELQALLNDVNSTVVLNDLEK